MDKFNLAKMDDNNKKIHGIWFKMVSKLIEFSSKFWRDA